MSRPYLRVLDGSELLDVVYQVLEGGDAIRGKEDVGLFRDFNPSLYTKGRLPLADHFVNLFAGRLRKKLMRLTRSRTDDARRAGPQTVRQRVTARVGGIEVDVELSRLGETILEALNTLNPPEQLVIIGTYWNNLSARAIGRDLDLDHKTVKERHDVAIRKLGRFLTDDRAA